MKIKKFIAHNIVNIPGWRTNRHLVVIESDDWGAIRMPSKEVYEQFLKEGIRVDNDPYCRYDSLATKEDLEILFEALQSVKDKMGNRQFLQLMRWSPILILKKSKNRTFKNIFMSLSQQQ